MLQTNLLSVQRIIAVNCIVYAISLNYKNLKSVFVVQAIIIVVSLQSHKISYNGSVYSVKANIWIQFIGLKKP